MPIDYTKTAEGDKLDAASLNDRFDEVAGLGPDRGINNLSQEDLERFSLRKEHLPSIINTSDFSNGLCAVGPLVSSIEIYNTAINIGVIGTPPGYLTTFGALGANPPYGPTMPADTGWRIPQHGLRPDGVTPADAAELDVGLARTNQQIGDYKGLLVRLGISLRDCGKLNAATIPLFDIESMPSVVIGIGWQDDLGARQVIERSIRWCHVGSRMKESLDTFTFISPDDIPAGRSIDKVFGVIAGGMKVTLIATTDAPKPMIDFYQLDVLPIRFGDM